MGANWVGPTQDEMYKLIKEFGLKVQKQYNKGKAVLDLNKQLSTYEGNIGQLTMFGRPAEMDGAYAKLTKLSEKIDVLHPQNYPEVHEFDHTTYGEWIKANVKNDGAQRLMHWFVKVCLAGDPSEISLLFFLYFLKNGGGYQRLVNIENGAQQETIIGGSQQISVKMAEKLERLYPSCKIVLNSSVAAIKQSELTGVVTVETHSRAVHCAKYAIVTVPTSLAGRIYYSPPVPALRDHLTQRMPIGCVIKVIVTYARPWWREKGFSGEIISDQEPCALFYDKSSHDEKLFALVGFMAGQGARKWSQKSAKEREEAVLNQISRCHSYPDAKRSSGYYEMDWSQEEWSRGCYVNLMTPGVISDCAQHLRKPHGRVYWAGSETALRWMAYMEGALESGIRTAGEVSTKFKHEIAKGASRL